jgi:hypothetical protein
MKPRGPVPPPQRARARAKAARRPMCVSVFGPSQQGKSYLVGSLARRDPAPCLIRFGEETRDFFADINPAGGKESTGLVTRFTVRPVQGLPGLPVVCRMLSQGDVIKIVANAFMEDFDRDTVRAMEPAEVEAWIARFRTKAAAAPMADFGSDDVFDLFEYFERYFRNHPVHAALKPGPWQELETLAPRLSTLEGKTVAQLWDFLFRGDQVFSALEEGLKAREKILATVTNGKVFLAELLSKAAPYLRAKLKEATITVQDERQSGVLVVPAQTTVEDWEAMT